MISLRLSTCLALTGALLTSTVAATHAATITPLQTADNHVQVTKELLQFIENYHYQPRAIDDAFAADVLNKFLDSIDPQRIYLTAADLKAYEHLSTSLDDSLKRGDHTDLVALFNLMQQRRLSYVQYYLDWLKDDTKQFDYSQTESIPVYLDQHPRLADQAALQDRWSKLLKNQFINGFLSDETEVQIRQRLIKRYDNQLKRLAQVEVKDMYTIIANSITQVAGPHTAYLSPRNVEDFNIDMSLSLEGIGAVLQRDTDYTKIVRIVAGGPADKAGELKAADYIIGVAQEGEDMVDITGWRLDNVVNLIRGPKGSRVQLQIIPGGDLKEMPRVIEITRDKVKLEDQAATKEIITLQTDLGEVNIGVIKIPSFYMDFDAYNRGERDYRSTTRDVFNLVAELRESNVNGIVIDLRNNGGGSLTEANQLTGLFIEKGPTVQVRYANGQIEKHQDRNPMIIYTGPMAVLVNRGSASASEIFAGALQDYQRALVVGSQTYGKGTVQSLVNISEGQIKYTQSKFYRVTGDSTQNRGVLPDVELPSLIDHSRVGESNLDYVLPWDQVAAQDHPRYINLPQIAPFLNEQQQTRSAADPDLAYAMKVVEYRQQEDEILSLNLQTRKDNWQAEEQWYLDAINELRVAKEQTPVTDIDDHEFDYETADKDPYLQATAQVLVDWLRLAQ